jgi:general secretion pathway protein B
MSYILDALRKSDKQRQRGTAPTLLTAQATATPAQPATLRYVLLAVALVGAGIAIGWLRPWQPEPPAPAAAPLTAAKPPQSSPRQTASAPLPVPPEIAGTQEQEPPAQKSTSTAPPAPVPTNAVIKQDRPAPARTESHRAPTRAVAAVPKKTATREKPARTGAAPEQRVMTMAELPVQIQQEIPGMSISVHAYSSQPGNRLVSINDRLLREGMSVAPGLTLEQITPDGMIFSYKGYRFSRRVQGSGTTAETR